MPLAPTLDSVGFIARSTACCAALDAIVSGEASKPLSAVDCSGLRFLVPTTVVLDNLQDEVAKDFKVILSRLSALGAHIIEAPFPEFGEVATMSAKGGFPAAESHAWHRSLIQRAGDQYDPRVRSRILRGAEQNAADFIDLIAARRSLISRSSARIAPFDAMLMPTVPMIAPRLCDISTDEVFTTLNLRALRNPTLINMIDGCAISIPMNQKGAAPTGLMVASAAGADHRVLAIATCIEKAMQAR